jgi:hypothetical protein
MERYVDSNTDATKIILTSFLRVRLPKKQHDHFAYAPYVHFAELLSVMVRIRQCSEILKPKRSYLKKNI